jgi:hypothetical protein
MPKTNKPSEANAADLIEVALPYVKRTNAYVVGQLDGKEVWFDLAYCLFEVTNGPAQDPWNSWLRVTLTKWSHKNRKFDQFEAAGKLTRIAPTEG